MQIKTFRAKSMPQALDLVRQELGAEATVLHTRELNTGLMRRMLWGRAYEIAATAEGGTPESNLMAPSPWRGGMGTGAEAAKRFATQITPAHQAIGDDSDAGLDLTSLPSPASSLQPLLDLDFDAPVAQDLLDRFAHETPAAVRNPHAAHPALAEPIASELRTTGPIHAHTGAGRIVALVGPTGVGKTTTIAKLAANYRLKEGRRVGLITVDTYRIAAVEQLGAYAEIIDLPMEVVTTPREMRAAVDRLRDYDLILMDTAGRSPRDEVRIRELRSMLAEANPHEVHLVLSAASSSRSLAAAAETFAPVGVTANLITKLDEATGLGHLLTLARRSRLPFSYLTNGQNVPDDIAVAEARQLAHLMLNIRDP
jgi:flagellar biosynthesis protein FlhF